MTRVQIPAYTDRWMMGDRYGEIVSTHMGKHARLRGGRGVMEPLEIAVVELDKSGKTIRVILADCEVVS
jgi:hypothetical protein